MTSAKPILWIVVGLLIGVSGAPAVRAAVPQEPKRLEVRGIPGQAAGGGLDQWAYWIRDTRTGACWLALGRHPGDPVALAPAPKEACE